jgi:hypothetical protein
MPVYAVSNTNPMFADPARYFPGCTCQVAFLSFIVWMISLLIIAMFQYGEKRKRKLTAFGFSIVAIILAFIIYSIPLWTMVWMLNPSGFKIDPETDAYVFSKYGEKESESMQLTGKYTREELDEHIRSSRSAVVLSWAFMSVLCVGAMVSIPALLKRQEKKREQAAAAKRKKRRSKGRVGTRIVKGKEEIDKKKDKKGKK